MRLVFDKDDQVEFFSNVKEISGMNRDELGLIVGIVGRSFSDWANGSLLPTQKGVGLLSDMFKIPIPTVLEEREEWWSGRVNGKKGAMTKFKKYGYFGELTKEDRSRGGRVSQRRRKENPGFYGSLGCNIALDFATPELSEDLAELVGIILGDGGITTNQCKITLHAVYDRKYSIYVKRLIENLFRCKAHLYYRSGQPVVEVVVNGVEFVRILEKFDLMKGNKIRLRVEIPGWVKSEKDLWFSCMRGLFDTDGGTFTHKHWCGGYRYRHFGLVYASASKPLLMDFCAGLDLLKIKYRIKGVHVFIENMSGVQTFISGVKPSNTKHLLRYIKHMSAPTRI